MRSTTLTIKIDKKLRDDAKKTADRMGIPLTTAVNAMVRKFARDGVLVLEADCPFPSHTPNAETRRSLLEKPTAKNSKRMTFKQFEEYVRSVK